MAKPLEKVYDWYSFKILPTMGKMIAGDAESYRYLAGVHPHAPRPEGAQDPDAAMRFCPCGLSQHVTGGVCALHGNQMLSAPCAQICSDFYKKGDEMENFGQSPWWQCWWVIHGQADAKRTGGGSSFGKQSDNAFTQREASVTPLRIPSRLRSRVRRSKTVLLRLQRLRLPHPRNPWGPCWAAWPRRLGLAWLANSAGHGRSLCQYADVRSAGHGDQGGGRHDHMRRRKGSACRRAPAVHSPSFAGNLGGDVNAPQAHASTNPRKKGQ